MGELKYYLIHTNEEVVRFTGTGHYYDHSEDAWNFFGPDGDLVVASREFKRMRVESVPDAAAEPAPAE